MNQQSDARTKRRTDGDDRDQRRRNLPEMLGGNARGVQSEIEELFETLEAGEDPTIAQINSLRTELAELEAAIEDLVVPLCPGATPWEYAGEHIPQDRRDELVGCG